MSTPTDARPQVSISTEDYVARWQAEAAKQTDRAIQAELAMEAALRERDEARDALEQVTGPGKVPGESA
jgi:hypothetical protein